MTELDTVTSGIYKTCEMCEMIYKGKIKLGKIKGKRLKSKERLKSS